MEMEVLFTYKNQLLASDVHTCVTSTCQKVEWSRAFISASCLNLRTVKFPLFSNHPIKAALAGATTALLFYRGTTTSSGWRVAAACDYWKKTPNKYSAAGPRPGPAVSPLHRVVMVTGFISPLHALLLNDFSSHLWKSPWCRQIHDRCRIIVTKRASCFLLDNWTQPREKQIHSAVDCSVFASTPLWWHLSCRHPLSCKKGTWNSIWQHVFPASPVNCWADTRCGLTSILWSQYFTDECMLIFVFTVAICQT